MSCQVEKKKNGSIEVRFNAPDTTIIDTNILYNNTKDITSLGLVAHLRAYKIMHCFPKFEHCFMAWKDTLTLPGSYCSEENAQDLKA